MTDEDIIQRVAGLFGVRYVHRRGQPRDSSWKPAYKVVLRGRPAIELMHRLRPLMGSRRQAQIDAATSSYLARGPGDNTRKLTWPLVEELRGRIPHEPLLGLSKEFGVSRKTLRRIRDREIWKPQTPPTPTRP